MRMVATYQRERAKSYLEALGGALRAELLKLDQRPAVWILLGIALALLGLFSYLLPWLLYTHPPQGVNPPRGVTLSQLKQPLYPIHLVSTAVTASNIPSALALILGVLFVGSEYSWGTFKTLLTQRPGRLQTLIGKLLAMEIALGAAVLLFFAVAAFFSFVLALIDGQPVDEWPAGSTILAGILASWLSWSWQALFGATLAFAFRQSALAIGLGLAYSFVIEGVILNLAGSFGGDFIRTLEKLFPGPNASALLTSFEDLVPGNPAHHPLVGASEATLVLILYCLAAAIASAILVTRRDIR
jgi:ABC-2 type transport system permease protein